MGKIRYFKFVALNNEERIIRYDGETTSGFIDNRWLIEPSLIYKINGRVPDPTLQEITEAEAMKIAGIKNGNKFFYYISVIIPISLIIIAIILGGHTISTIMKNKTEKELFEMSSSELDKRLKESLLVSKDEKNITDNFNKVDSLYAMIPFGGSSKNAYQGDETKIEDVDPIVLVSSAFGYAIETSNYEVNEGMLGDFKYSYVVYTQDIINNIGLLFNGYNITSLPTEFTSPDGIYYCKRSANNYVCQKDEKEAKTYRAHEILLVTKEDENVYLYEASIYVKNQYSSNIDDTAYYQLYRYSNETELFQDCKDKTCIPLDNPYESFKYKAVIYRHTFKKDGSGGYYWYSTEYNNKLD